MKSIVTQVLALALAVLGWGLGSAPAPAETPIQIHIMSWIPPQQWKYYVDYANAFIHKKYPNVEVVGETTWQATGGYSKLTTSLIAGSGPDIYYFNLQNYDPGWIAAGYMLPIDGLLDQDPAYKADIVPSVRNAWTYQGKLYALPNTIGQYAVYYNRDRFADAGLPRPANNWTITGEFADDIQKLTVFDANNKPVRYGFQLETNLGGRFMNFIFSNGGRIVDPSVTHAMTDQPAYVDTVDFFNQLRLKHEVDVASSWTAFLQGKVSMYESGIFHQGYITDGAKFDWGVAPIPVGTAGQKSVANTNAWVINPKSQHVDIAWQIAKALSGPEFGRTMLDQHLDGLPVSLSTLQTYFYSTLPKNLSRAEGDIWLRAIDYIQPFPKTPLFARILKLAQTQERNVFAGKTSAKNAGRIAAEQIDALIAAQK